MPELAIVCGSVLLALVVVAVVAVHSIHEARETTRAALTSLQRATSSALILRGLNPHVVEPESFGPTGMSRQDEDKYQAPPAPSAKDEPPDETEGERVLREAEAEYFSQMRQYGPQGERVRPGAPPGASPDA